MLFSKTKVTFKTKLSKNDCLVILKENTTHGFGVSFTGLRGMFFGDKFKLSKITWYRNSWAISYMAKLQEDIRGTEIKGYFGFDPFVKTFSVLFTLLLGFILYQGLSLGRYEVVWIFSLGMAIV